MTGYEQITKEAFYKRGGFSNPKCVRIQRGKSWKYFYRSN